MAGNYLIKRVNSDGKKMGRLCTLPDLMKILNFISEYPEEYDIYKVNDDKTLTHCRIDGYISFGIARMVSESGLVVN